MVINVKVFIMFVIVVAFIAVMIYENIFKSKAGIVTGTLLFVLPFMATCIICADTLVSIAFDSLHITVGFAICSGVFGLLTLKELFKLNKYSVIIVKKDDFD